nr:glycine cleavage system protein GcvH [uncultured Lichenicoccus sp.]
MADIRYTKEHEWVRLEDDGTTTIGITDHAQEALGDVVFIELPDRDRDLAEGESCAVVESVKAASDVFAPFAGKVLEVNETLAEDSSLVNRDAEGEAWFFRMEPADPEAFNGLMEEAEYTAYLETL